MDAAMDSKPTNDGLCNIFDLLGVYCLLVGGHQLWDIHHLSFKGAKQ
jgi:hypothetical protein